MVPVAMSARIASMSSVMTSLQSPTIGTSRVAVLADLGRVDVGMDDLGVGREGIQLTGDAVVETRTEGDQ